ncbi:MAG: hypothetical protein Q4D81_01445 [Eubacteriales bacterium]|nr:hypothetical protein [Eubacteriales bacterium]
MKFIKSLLTLLLIGGIGLVLITTRPSGREFARWYVEQNQTGLGGFFDEAFVTVVEQSTKTRDYLVFSVFELSEEERYVGIMGFFFGRNTVEQAQKTLNELLEQAEEIIRSQDGSK